MTLYYAAGFPVTASGTYKVTLTVASVAATVAANTYCAVDLSAVTLNGTYTAFAVALKTALDATATGPYTVTWNGPSSLTFTISRATTFTLGFTSGTGDYAAHVLGFATGTSYTSANTYTSVKRPYYALQPAITARSTMLPFIYEPNDIVAEAVSDGGTSYAVAKNTSEKWADWTQQMEPKEAVYALDALTTAPWTWQDFFRHTRGQYPFLVAESALGAFANGVYKNRAEAAVFKATPVSSDWDNLYNMTFKTRWLGAL